MSGVSSVDYVTIRRISPFTFALTLLLKGGYLRKKRKLLALTIVHATSAEKHHLQLHPLLKD
jgi:hypothetical protein